ncbi:hypothetical protein JCM3765_003369 [Sporobolomyces pararoseus]
MEGQTSSKLLQLPPEVLLHTLAFTSPRDCAKAATVNRSLNVLCSTWTLYRDLLLSLCDLYFPTTEANSDYPYQTLCRRFVQATAALEKIQGGLPPPTASELIAILETLVHVATSRPPAGKPSLNEVFLEKYLSPSSSTILSLHPSFSSPRPYLRSQARKPTPEDVVISELASQLHSLSTPSLVSIASPSIRNLSREIVYERLNFTKSSAYGPLKSDGSGLVDYRKVEAIQILMNANLEEAKTMGWGQESGEEETVSPTGWSSTRTGSASSSLKLEGKEVDERDWAGITTHEWRGTYAFLHFPVYHSFNHHRTSTYIPSLAEESEAVGDCMSLKLELLPEGEEISPPMEAFRTSSNQNVDARGVRRGGSDLDSDEDSDFDENALDDEEEDTSASSSDDEDDLTTHFVTNRPRPERNTPPTSPPESHDVPPPIGPLPPPSKSRSSELPSTPTPSNPFPKLSFRGTSMPLQLRTLSFTGTFVNSQSHFNMRDRSIRGTVEMNEVGEVIWKYIIRYGGIDHWAMTGVQVGGPKSAFGVVGTWTCADRDAADDEGPNGPFWYWPNMPEA